MVGWLRLELHATDVASVAIDGLMLSHSKKEVSPWSRSRCWFVSSPSPGRRRRSLRSCRATIVWFALRLSKSEFGIFDAFPDDAGRKAHLNGPIAAALMAKAGELLAEPPKIEQVDVLAAKLAG
jgi:hypothetical protein